MKLPIYLDPGTDTIITVYRDELSQVQDVAEMKAFIARWRDLIHSSVKEDLITDKVLQDVKEQNIDETMKEYSDLIVELVIPRLVMRAMILAQTYVVPVNCAFVQSNGGFSEFEDD